MNPSEFERLVLRLWMTTRVPMTRANLLFYTGAPGKKIDKWLDALSRDGDEHAALLEVDSDDDGELIWKVRGSSRPTSGTDRVEEAARLDQLSREVRGSSVGAGGGALVPVRGVERALARMDAGSQGEKSVVLSGILSGVFGPLGWLYAGSFREVVPAILVFAIITRFFPVLYFLAPAGLLSAVVGVLYAMSHNQAGHRAPLVLDDPAPPGSPGSIVRRR